MRGRLGAAARASAIAVALASAATACNALLGPEGTRAADDGGSPDAAAAGDPGGEPGTGAPGSAGAPGAAGMDGGAGAPGTPGAAGTAGTPGAAGSPGTGGPGDGGPVDPRFPAWPMPNAPVDGGGPHPASFVTGADGVLDQVTGLLWEHVPPQAIAYYLVEEQRCDQLPRAAGFGPFRLPSRIELVSVLDYSRANPAIALATFPGAQSELFWTTSRQGGDRIHVDVADGTTKTFNDAPGGMRRSRCVASRVGVAVQTPPPARLRPIDSGAAMLDVATGLAWQAQITAVNQRYTWGVVASACAGLGAAWRVPTVKELATLVDESRTGAPWIDPLLQPLPSTSETWFWSATPSAAKPNEEAWGIDFGTGMVTRIPHAQRGGYVRCVRDGA